MLTKLVLRLTHYKTIMHHLTIQYTVIQWEIGFSRHYSKPYFESYSSIQVWRRTNIQYKRKWGKWGNLEVNCKSGGRVKGLTSSDGHRGQDQSSTWKERRFVCLLAIKKMGKVQEGQGQGPKWVCPRGRCMNDGYPGWVVGSPGAPEPEGCKDTMWATSKICKHSTM